MVDGLQMNWREKKETIDSSSLDTVLCRLGSSEIRESKRNRNHSLVYQ